MSTVIDTIERAQLRRVPEFRAGDRVRVHFIVIEGTRRRTQVFEGVAIKRQGQGVRETFTVRKQSFGVGVERTFPLHSPKIERIEVASRGDVRRAKLYYLRERVGKAARVRERGYVGPEESIEPGLLHGHAQAAGAPSDEELFEGEPEQPAEELLEGEPEQPAEEIAQSEPDQPADGPVPVDEGALAANGSAEEPQASPDVSGEEGEAESGEDVGSAKPVTGSPDDPA